MLLVLLSSMHANKLPYILSSEALEAKDVYEILADRTSEIDRHLTECGAILIRGFGVDSAEKFQRCIDRMSVRASSYVDGNSPRTKISGSIYTSTEYPAEFRISLHNELSYSHSWPSRLYFCCVVAPQSGGSTSIADSRAILRRISAPTRRLFEEKGITYVRNLHGGVGTIIGKSWQKTFETDSRADVEAYCRAGNIKYDWNTDGGLRLIQVGPATARHPQTGDEVWFNQLEQFHPSSNPPEVYEALSAIYESPLDMPQYACFGDGQPVSDDVLAEVRAAMAAESIEFPWESGDLMIVDNMLTAHGRSPFVGQRKILVSMS